MSISGHEFEQIPRMVKGREAWRVAVYGGFKEPDSTERLNNNKYQ